MTPAAVIAIAGATATGKSALALALDLAPETALAFTIDNLSLTRIDHIPGPGIGHCWRVGAVNQPPL